MAIDTREERQSAVHLLVPIFAPGVDPSTLDRAGRQASVWVYSGIPVPIVTTVSFVNWIQLEID